MRFKHQSESSLPEVNLIPMMDVLMSVLTFFIIISMTLTGERLGNIILPGARGGTNQAETKPFIVGLNQQGEILIANQTANEAELTQKMQSYLTNNPDGEVIVKADRELSYKQVSGLLKKMGEIGGDRVSLAIQQN